MLSDMEKSCKFVSETRSFSAKSLLLCRRRRVLFNPNACQMRLPSSGCDLTRQNHPNCLLNVLAHKYKSFVRYLQTVIEKAINNAIKEENHLITRNNAIPLLLESP